jgi:hypothetical protein
MNYAQPWKTLCGFPPTEGKVKLLIPNGAWRADTVITDTDGREYFVLLEMENSMRTYEAIFGDLDGRRLVCVKRHITKAFWQDGYYFCTYRPNYRGQKPLGDRDLENRKIYPHSYLEVNPMKGKFNYRFLDDDRQMTRSRLSAMNPWMGFMMGCCTCCMRCARFTAQFKKRNLTAQVFVDQWRNIVKVGPNNDLLAALCIAYVFDKCQNQPMVTLIGADEEDYAAPEDDNVSIESGSSGSDDGDKNQVEMTNMEDKFDDEPDDSSTRRKQEHEQLKHLDLKPIHDDQSVASRGGYALPGGMLAGVPNGAPRTDPGGRSVGNQSQRSHQTQQSQRSHQTQQSQRSHQTQQSQRPHQTQQSQRSHQDPPELL